MRGIMKGVSQYISVALLIAITVALATLFVGWAVTLTQTQSQTVANKTKSGVDCTRAKLSIEDVYLDTSANKARISVRNSGLLDDAVVSAVVLSTSGSVSRNLTILPMALKKGDPASIELNITGMITACANFSKAVVTTTCVSREFDGTPKNC